MIKIFAIVPVKKFENSKMRLSPILNTEDRIHLSGLMLDDTLSALTGAKNLQQIVVVSVDKRAEEIASKRGATFLREERESGVNIAVELANLYCTNQGADATVVIPQDLPLLDAQDVDMVCSMVENEGNCVVISPSLRYDGTNLLLRKPPTAIQTFYDSNSYENHIKAANKLGVAIKLYFSKRLMSDIDTPDDARELSKEVGSSKTLEFIKSKTGKPSSPPSLDRA